METTSRVIGSAKIRSVITNRGWLRPELGTHPVAFRKGALRRVPLFNFNVSSWDFRWRVEANECH